MGLPGEPRPDSPLEGEILPVNLLLILRKMPFPLPTLNRFDET